MITDPKLLTVGYYLEFYSSGDIYLIHIDSISSDGVTMTEIYSTNIGLFPATNTYKFSQIASLRYLPTSCTTWTDVQSTYPELFL